MSGRGAGPLLMITQAYGAHGGVQTYSRRLAEILSAWGEPRRWRPACVSLLDRAPLPSMHRHPVEYAGFAAACGSKGRFVTMALRLGRELRPGVAVAAHLGLAPVALVLKAAGLVQSYVVVLHGIEAWRRVGAAERVAVRAAAEVIATTHYTARLFARQNGCHPSSITVVPLALPDLDVESADPPAKRTSTMRVLSVGRLAASDAYKGFDVLIEAVGRARSAGARIDLAIIGEGDDRPRLEARARALKADDAVRFLGSVPDERLNEEFRRCDLFALPSSGEGFGIVFLEAMRFGKPCIGGNHGGTPEIISHGVDGFLVEHGDVAGLADRLAELWREPELRIEMGRHARCKVKNAYLFPRMRNEWFAVLDRVGGKKTPCAVSRES